MSLLALPEELLTNVLAVLPNAVFEGSCRAVCRRWRDLKSSSAFRAARREVDERVLVVTGWEDGNSYTVLENFALINGQWRKMTMSEVCVHGGAAVHGHSVCVFGIEGSPPLALTNGVWTVLPRLPELEYGYPTNLPSGDEKPLMASLPLDVFAENVAPSSAAADDASESSHDGCWQPAGELPSDDDSEEGDSTDSDGDDEDDDEDGNAL